MKKAAKIIAYLAMWYVLLLFSPLISFCLFVENVAEKGSFFAALFDTFAFDPFTMIMSEIRR